jgi:predicted metal-dependent hydrolase
MSKNNYIQFGKSKIDFSLEFLERKSLGIQVHPDRSVKVLAPSDSSLEKVKEKLKAKAPWILKQQDFFLSFHPRTPKRKYISGETHLYLGRQYRLKVVEDSSESVKLQGGFIRVFTNDTSDKKRIKLLLNKWYTEKAKIHFNQLFEATRPLFVPYKTAAPYLSIRRMSKRWGSCGIDGKILLNTELIKAPKPCIEYVLAHEFCHLVHPNHSRAFFRLLGKVCPEWGEVKERLERGMV